ncbi:NFACT family protein [Candidatus Woesearchaeota archaeon]|nr:NFACT family protein [Candidatus Woesearchaeota archaeon]MBL7050625.1 NFACT family protein [Candidatus Woesearchaeota archaeon]
MKLELTALDMKYLIDELQVLIGGRVDQIYQIGKRDFFFRFHVPNKGKKILKMFLPGSLYLTEKLGRMPQTPMGYCAFLRKYLSNARVREIRQQGFERILEIVFEKKESFVLVVEMFSSGNMILCNENHIMLSPLEGQDWRCRSIRKGLKYEFPPEREDIFKLNLVRFKEIIAGSERENIVKTLAVDFGLGGVYAEEVCFGVIDKGKIDVSDEEIEKLFKSLDELLGRKSKPVVYKGRRAFPFALKSFEGEFKEFESFSLALDSVRFVKQVDFKDKVEIIIEKQEKNVKMLEKDIEENGEIADLIYNNYELVADVLKQINVARKEHSWGEIKEKLKGHKVVKEINEGEGKIIIEI